MVRTLRRKHRVAFLYFREFLADLQCWAKQQRDHNQFIEVTTVKHAFACLVVSTG
jgi:hypothetical protein